MSLFKTHIWVLQGVGEHVTRLRLRQPWYQPPIMQPMSKLTTKLPYRKLQYPTYVKDINLDVHIRVFKKAIKTNGEIVKSTIINLFGFTSKDNIFEWGKNYV